MTKTGKKIFLIFFAAAFVFASFAFVFGLKATVVAETVKDHCIFSEDFDSLSSLSDSDKFIDVGDEDAGHVTVVGGGVTDGGKVAQVDKWGRAKAQINGLAYLDELTISAWVYANNPEQRIFSVENGYNYFLKGGGIANDDHSIVAWPTVEGSAVVSNDDPWGHSWGAGICSKEQDGTVSELYYLFTVAVERNCIRFYKNNLLIDSYYITNDRESKDVSKFIENFYDGLKTSEISIGGGAFDIKDTGNYYIDNLRVYDFAVKSYNELYEVIKNSGNNLSSAYSEIVNNAAVGAPIVFYDFSSVSDKTVINKGTKSGANGTLYDECDVSSGTLKLNGSGFLILPENLFTGNAYSISMDVKRTDESNSDLLYVLHDKWFDDSSVRFADCWFQGNNAVITDHFSSNASEANYNKVQYSVPSDWFNLTSVYNGSSLKIFVDGVLIATKTLTDPTPASQLVAGRIGMQFWDRAFFKGEIDNVKIYDFALGESQSDPIVKYDFSSVDGTTVNNAGTKSGANGTLNGEYEIIDGTLKLNGRGYLKLPDNLFTGDEYSVSMDIKRSTTWNRDLLYVFAKGGFDGHKFADCWIQSTTDGDVKKPVAWVITDHYNYNQSEDANWKNTPIEPTKEWMNVTTVYKAGNLKIYIDGVKCNDYNLTSPISPSQFVSGWIGMGFWDRDNFRGEIDNVAIYDYALAQESVINLANKVTVRIDMPESATSGDNLTEYTTVEFERREDLGFSFTSADIATLGIDFNSKQPQTFMNKQGVTVKSYFGREINDYSDSIVFGPFDKLPEKAEFSYTDGTKEVLAIEWYDSFDFGNKTTYTGSATDFRGRVATVSINASYTATKEELKVLIDKAGKIIDYKPLYEDYEYEDFLYQVEYPYTNAIGAYEQPSTSEEDILQATADLKNAMDNTYYPLRLESYELYSLDVNVDGWTGVDINANEIEVVWLISGSDGGIELRYHTANGQKTESVRGKDIPAGNYKLSIGRYFVAEYGTALLNMYLVKNGTIVASLENVVSENGGDGSIRGAVKNDVSMLSYYTSINRSLYDTGSIVMYDEAMETSDVKSEITDWVLLSSTEMYEMINNAKAAFDLLVPARIVSVNSFDDINCKVGTDIESLLPSVANATFSNDRTMTLRITWDKSNLDTSKAGEFTLNGYVIDNDGSHYRVYQKVIVQSNEKEKTYITPKTVLIIVASLVVVGITLYGVISSMIIRKREEKRKWEAINRVKE